jgi:hypothetical protein
MNAIFIVQAILLLAFIVLAILVLRGAKTTEFRLLMLASVCYFVQHSAPFALGLVYSFRGWKASGSMIAWMRSWWWLANHMLDCLFLAILIAAFVFFIRKRSRVDTDRPNQAMQPTASPRTASLHND